MNDEDIINDLDNAFPRKKGGFNGDVDGDIDDPEEEVDSWSEEEEEDEE